MTYLINEFELKEWEIKPFPPGHLAEYNILPDGKVALVSLRQFFDMEKPLLTPVALEEGINPCTYIY